MNAVRIRWPLVVVALSGLISAGYCLQTGLAADERNDLSSRRLLEIEDEVNRRLGVPLPSTPIARATLSDWSDLIRNLHRAASRARLSEFVYSTGAMIPVSDPLDRLPAPPTGDPEEKPTGDLAENDASEVETPETPYRAMTARVDGGGRYDQIVRFVEELAHAEPPLTLDRISITAGPHGPRFLADVHLTTALPVETVDETIRPVDFEASSDEQTRP